MQRQLEEAVKRLGLAGEEKKRAEAARAFLSAVTTEHSPAFRCEHTPPASFQREAPVGIEMIVRPVSGNNPTISVHLHYRHVNQAELYVVADMEKRNGSYQTTIPGEYTDTLYPLQYFFEVCDATGRAWLHPGFDTDLSNQPYYVIRQGTKRTNN
jgi:coproporphyrinogen III oxidase